MQNGTIPIGDLAEPRVEQTGPRGREFTYVDIGSVDRETKRIVDAKVLPTSKAPSRARQVLKAGDVLVSMTRPNLNAVAIVPPDLNGAIGSTGFYVLRARDTEPGFLFYAVQSPDFIDAMCQKVQGALYPAVRPRDISSFCLPNFSLDAQRATVAEIEKQFMRVLRHCSGCRPISNAIAPPSSKPPCEGKLVPTEAELQKSAGKAETEFESGERLLTRILAERHHCFERRQAEARTKKDYVEPVKPETKALQSLSEGWTWGTWNQISNWVTYGFTRPMPHGERGIPIITAKGVNRNRIDFDGAHLTTSDAYGKLSEKDPPNREIF